MPTAFRRLIAPALLALALGGAASPPARETRYVVLLAGNPAGTATVRNVSDREQVFTFEFNDRGRGPRTTTREVVDGQGLPVRVEISGHDYWKNQVSETFERNGNRAAWSHAAGKVERVLARPAFYLGLDASPLETEVLARALLRAPGGRLDLLPSGMHTHVSPLDGALHIAAGVTTVRDLANDVDQLAALQRQLDQGAAVGPRLLKAGFIDGPGPFAGPTKVLVDPLQRMSDIRRVTLVVKDGAVLDPAAVHATVGVKPAA